jgi:hypothetical protein
MIRVDGSVRRTFNFPADVPTAMTFYSDYARIFSYLKHIRFVKAYNPDNYRMLYETMELSIYRVRIYCDLRAYTDMTRHTLFVSPLDGHTPVKSEATFNSLTGQGFYSSQSVFTPISASQCEIEYSLRLHAALPTPLGLQMIPTIVLEQIAHSITHARIKEIADGFIKRSINEFRRLK